MQIGRYDPELRGPENRMRPLTDNFRTCGVEMLQDCAQAAGEWVTIDEIGYLETACPEYCAAILALMEQKRTVTVVRKQNLPFLRSLCRRSDAFVLDLDSPYGQSGCVIMASGLGKRFGGNKLLARLKGRPLIQYALDATEGIFCGPCGGDTASGGGETLSAAERERVAPQHAPPQRYGTPGVAGAGAP